MYQQQVNNNNNTISCTLDCCESRTVRTISTKHLQRQQQPTVKVPALTGGVAPLVSALNFITENTITKSKSATQVAPTTEMQSVCQTRSLRRKPLMKTYALLPLICIIICAQVSTTSGRTLHGRKQFHSLQNRMQHHKKLMLNEREYAPKHTVQIHPHHRRIVRSNDPVVCPENFKIYLTDLQTQSKKSFETLKFDINNFTLKRFNQNSSAAYQFRSGPVLNLSHPYTNIIKRTSDTTEYHFNFTEKCMELFRTEIVNISTTLKYLKFVYDEIDNDENKKTWRNINPYIIEFLEMTNQELTNTENVVNVIMNSTNVTKADISLPEYNKDSQPKEWLFIVESVSFLEYLIQLSQNLSECKTCN